MSKCLSLVHVTVVCLKNKILTMSLSWDVEMKIILDNTEPQTNGLFHKLKGTEAKVTHPKNRKIKTCHLRIKERGTERTVPKKSQKGTILDTLTILDLWPPKIMRKINLHVVSNHQVYSNFYLSQVSEVIPYQIFIQSVNDFWNWTMRKRLRKNSDALEWKMSRLS